MGAKRVRSNQELISIGRRHGSADIQKEASEVSARWARDVPVLKAYGLGQAARASFEGLRTAHGALLEKRPDSVSQKATALTTRNQATTNAWRWVDKAALILGQLAETDDVVSHDLSAARPTDDGDLPTKIPALAALLDKHKARLAEDADVQARIDEAAGLAQALTDAPGQVAAAKSAPVMDTAEIDLLDGKLYLAMVSLNEAGKKAIRHGELAAPASDYRFQHLNARGPAKPTKPTEGAPA